MLHIKKKQKENAICITWLTLNFGQTLDFYKYFFEIEHKNVKN